MNRRERQRRRRRNRGSTLGRVFALTGVLVVCAVAVGALAIAGWVVNVAQSAPDLSSLHPSLPGSPSRVYAADGTLLGYIATTSIRTPVAGDQIPQRLKEATIAIEDRRFYQHGALDYQGILRAAIKDALKGGNGLQGASTLTMQLIDNTYLPHTFRGHHDLKYKIVQAKLAEQLENQHSKTWILENYLNDVPYGTVGGQTAYGVGAAAQMFFDKPVQRLNLEQAALLAGLPQAPSEYNPFIDSGAARRRRNEVLQAMVTARYITQRQADIASSRPLEVRRFTALNFHKEPYAFDFIVAQVRQDLCPGHPNHCGPLEHGGLKIHTTLDLHDQALARAAIASNESDRAAQGGPGTAAAALASVDSSNGHILAIASSSTYNQTSFDYATQAHRQPGSAFKTFALMTLIHDYQGDPDSTYYTSEPLAAGWLPQDPTWSVHTAEDSYQGVINITKATILSDNTVYVQLAADLGWDKIDNTAHAMGVTSPLDGLPAEVIGGLRVGVTPLEMADAYATLSNGGSHVPPTIIDTVNFPDGSVDNFGNPAHTPVFPYAEAYAGTSVLKQVITSGTGTAAGYGCPAAGKTGTANNLENAWFVGYTPKISTAVWVGYPGGNFPMSNGFGGALAAPIWHNYMQAVSGSYCGDWTAPDNPFQGTAFVGSHAASGPATTPSSGNQGNQSQTQTSTSSASGATPPPAGGGAGGAGFTPGSANGGGSPSPQPQSGGGGGGQTPPAGGTTTPGH